MQKLQIFVYKSKDSYQVGLLRNVQHLSDLGLANKKAQILSPPLVSSDAYQILETWKRRFGHKWAKLWWWTASKKKQHRLPTLAEGERISGVLERIKELLGGRLLSEQKLISMLRQEGVWPNDISRALDQGVHSGWLQQFPGMILGSWGIILCSRCQSEVTKSVPCLVCGSPHCLLCLECLPMGEHRSCSTLLTLKDSPTALRVNKVELSLDYELTQAQAQASQNLLEFWDERKGKALVWAACGAGKTEVTFPLIQRVLSEGHQVLFAIPRQDIVREMAERLSAAFPNVEVAAHYGGQPWLASGRLVVATTHQVLNFYKRFQLAILDEVDAFPYQGNEMLRFGLQRSLAPQGQLIEMTATPSSKHKYNSVITIPARYHGFPLPEPELIKYALPSWLELEHSQLPNLVLSALQNHDHPWLIFCPTIAACEAVQKVLTKALEQQVGLCHSKVDNRSNVIQDFRDGHLKYLVTTSVLERGVNFPGVGVIVLYADHRVFSISALVQIAGRVGRTLKHPSGTVFFVGSKKTSTMKKSQALIKELNQRARERGLLFNEEPA